MAHECIIDLRPLTKETGVTVDDVAKRLIDYGFHAPTMSFPVAGTLMIEPTESEDLAELDRFCQAMISIRAEIDKVGSGLWPADDNPLRNAPHTAAALGGEWEHPYSRQEAVFPAGVSPADKYWPPVRRIDGAYGDRNLVCSCPPLDEYEGSSSGSRHDALGAERPVRCDDLPVGQEFAGVLEEEDTVAQQAPALFRVVGHHLGGLAVGAAGGRAKQLVLTHDRRVLSLRLV